MVLLDVGGHGGGGVGPIEEGALEVSRQLPRRLAAEGGCCRRADDVGVEVRVPGPGHRGEVVALLDQVPSPLCRPLVLLQVVLEEPVLRDRLDVGSVRGTEELREIPV